MRLTLESDYALRMILYLSRENKKADAKTISSEMNVPLRFALKILRRLSMTGIVKSYKGASGGYELNKPPDQISFKAVIEAIEGPLYISRCLNDDVNCDRVEDKNQCEVHKKFDAVNKIVADELEKITFGDIIESVKHNA